LPSIHKTLDCILGTTKIKHKITQNQNEIQVVSVALVSQNTVRCSSPTPPQKKPEGTVTVDQGAGKMSWFPALCHLMHPRVLFQELRRSRGHVARGRNSSTTCFFPVALLFCFFSDAHKPGAGHAKRWQSPMWAALRDLAV
jgi:hypothetical protein